MANNPMYGSNKFDNKLANVHGVQDGGIFNFEDLPIISGAVAGAAAVATTHVYSDGLKLKIGYLGTQTLIGPIGTSSGMNYGFDQTNNDGIEWCLADATSKGIKSGAGITQYAVGSDAFYAELRFSIADVSGADECLFGFRKVEAFQAAVDDYDEMAAFNIVSGDIKTETILNNGGTTTTDLTSGGGDAAGNWANTGIHTLKVLVASDGAVTYAIDGATPTGAATFSFDSGELVTPFFHLLNDSDVAGAVVMEMFSHGRQ